MPRGFGPKRAKCHPSAISDILEMSSSTPLPLCGPPMSVPLLIEPLAERGIAISRRRLLGVAAGLAGLSFPAFFELPDSAVAAAKPKGSAKRCILIYCWGGMSHIDAWDLKPD